MRNVLFRRLEVVPVASVRGQDYRPAYCQSEAIIRWRAQGAYACVAPVNVSPGGNNAVTCSRNSRLTSYIAGYERVCYPAIPYIAPQLAYLIVPQGWDAGAVSLARGTGSGWYAQFSADTELDGVLAGVARSLPVQTAFSYSTCTHAISVVAGTIAVVERGRTVATVATNATGVVVAQVRLLADRVEYYVDGVRVHTSDTPADAKTAMCAVIYRSASVFDPVLAPFVVASAPITSVPDVVATTGARVIMRSEPDVGADGVPTAGMLAAPVFVARPHVRRPRTSAMVSTPQFRAAPTLAGAILGKLPRLRGFAAAGDGTTYYGVLAGALPRAGGRMLEAAKVAQVATLFGMLPALQFTSTGLVGALGNAEGATLRVRGVAAEEGMYYGAVFGAFPPFAALITDEAPRPSMVSDLEVIAVPDFHALGASAVALYQSSTVEVGGDMVLVTSLSESTLEAVSVAGEMTLARLMELIHRERVLIDDASGTQDWLAAEYITAMHGAIGGGAGLNYQGYVRAGGQTFAWRADGIYRVGEPGESIDLSVDFGADDFGAVGTKHVDTVHFGTTGSGEVLASLILDDGSPRYYRVVGGGENRRALLGKGLRARYWRMQLQVISTEEFELHNIEYRVAVSGRRLSSRR